MTRFLKSFAASLGLLALLSQAHAAPFLSTNDFIIAIDTDPANLPSNYPGGEAPINALDGASTSKYLNFAKLNSGIIVQPFIGSTTVQSIQLTTGDDAVERDPFSWELYGTNDPLSSVDNGDGSAENWTLIAQNDANLPEERQTLGPVQSFSNSTSYSAYRVLFPTVKDPGGANSMQIADIGLYESNDASGLSVWDAFETDVVAFAYAQPDSRYFDYEGPENVLDGSTLVPRAPQSGYPAAEGPTNILDGNSGTKFLNFGDVNSGFIVTPASGAAQVQSFQITTANDAAVRDPGSWQLYGTNDPIVSLDNSYGDAESWTLLDGGDLALPDERFTMGSVVPVSNAGTYTSYKMVFPTVKGPNDGTLQFADMSFYTSTDGTGSNILAPGDAILAIDESPATQLTKYLNFGGERSGLIVTPDAGAKVLTGFQITTANDFDSRDPTSYEIYGTNDPITSEANGNGDSENWTLISSGALDLPLERQTDDELISFANSTAYASYKVIFPTLRDPGENFDNSMQIANIQFFDDSVGVDVDLNDDGKVDGADFLLIQRTNPALTGDWQSQFGATGLASAAAAGVPEPTSLVLVVAAAALMAAAGRGRIGRS
ncbi:MAG: hypothetical protein KDA44_17885 [Planctomycetales bacterium]|nr:hypothetical protein [Planctomycetales bacterium]